MNNLFTLLIGIIYFVNINAQTPQLKWEQNYNGPVSGTDRITDMDFDPVNGNTYVTGVSDSTTGYNYVTIKYSSTGQVIWRKRYSGPQFQDSPNAIKYDPVNNAVYVTGKSRGSTTNFDWLTIRYNASTGDIVWTKTFNGNENGNDEAIDLDIDASGNIYVVGNVLEPCSDHLTTMLIKYSATGNVDWDQSIDDDFCRYDELAYKIAVNGNKVVVIYNQLNGSTYYAYAIGYFTSNGVCTDDFCRSVGVGVSSIATESYGIAFDGLGNVYISTGGCSVTKLNTDVYTVIWRNYPFGSLGWANNIIVDQNNYNVYVTGHCKKSDGDYDIITIKFNASGDSLWTKRYNGVGNGDDRGMFIAKDNLTNPNIYITGYTIQTNGKKQITTIKYDNNGNQLWSMDYGCSANDNVPINMFRDPNDNLYIAGFNNCNSSDEDYLTLGYCTLPGQPDAITGDTTVCGGTSQTYSISPVLRAISYIWTLPSGATGTSTTNSITVNYDTSAVSGNITVKGNNSCGDGATSTIAIIVIDKPTTPVITLNDNVIHSDAVTGNQWYNQNGLINGATNQDYSPTSNGDYYVIVTLAGCSSDHSNTINYSVTGMEQVVLNKTIEIYPNPVTNELIIEMDGNSNNEGFEILNSIGQVVFKGKLLEKTVVQTSRFLPGIYLIKFEIGKTSEFKKIVKE
jgi:hypothetical protein